MIRNILIVGIFCVLFSCSKSELNQEAEAEKINSEHQNNYKTLNVKGNVKSITCINYKQFIPDSLLSYLVTKEDFVFDTKGNAIEVSTYLEDEELAHKDVYQFDKMNNIIRIDSYSKDNEKKYTAYYFYNKQGGLLRLTNEKDNIKTYEAIYTFEELTDDYEKYRFKDGDYVVNIYSKGKKKSQTIYSNTNQVESQDVFKYDDAGRKIEKGSYQGNDTTKFVPDTWYTYDKSGRLIHDEGYYSHDYDQFGNVISKAGNEKETFTSKYIYDKKNNWIKRTSYLSNGKLRSILERKIEYFD
jgi:hypothetical protein